MKNNQDGQSTIEFIFSFIFAVSLILMVFNTSLNYASGYVTHYATFMSSRIYLVRDTAVNEWSGISSKRDGVDEAKKAFKERYNLSIFNINSDLEINNANEEELDAGQYLMVGGLVRYDRKIDLVGQITGGKKLSLISEAFLGREPVRAVCASRTCMAITGKDSCDVSMDVTLFDDGC
jgi:hypothetical protein